MLFCWGLPPPRWTLKASSLAGNLLVLGDWERKRIIYWRMDVASGFLDHLNCLEYNILESFGWGVAAESREVVFSSELQPADEQSEYRRLQEGGAVMTVDWA